MPSFKSLSSKVLGNIKKRGGANDSSSAVGDGDESSLSRASEEAVTLQGDTPEAVAARSVKAFCESGGPNQQNGDEVTFLPPIVESAESSPAAAAECARWIRKFLKKDYWTKPSYQYNALMLARILSDNPGQTFTRNFDAKFVDTARELLRNGRDLSVRQMLMETLDQFEHQKAWDEGLKGLIEMWKKEKEKAYKAYGGRGPPPPPPLQMQQQGYGFHPQGHSQTHNYFARAHTNNRLPSPVELANRLEEARTSANLLTQLVANTPSTEVLENDLVKEFADRCLSASRSIQGYMVADNPAPDNETMEALIDVNEELQRALNSQKRAVLSARKELGIDARSQDASPVPTPPETATNTTSNGGGGGGSGALNTSTGAGARPTQQPYSPFGGAPPRRPDAAAKGKGRQEPTTSRVDDVPPPSGPPPGRAGGQMLVSPISMDDDDQDERDPFRDPAPAAAAAGSGYRGKAPAIPTTRPPALEQPSMDHEPFHPGFGGGTTQSYLGRQDSAINKLQMHGAGAGTGEDAPANGSRGRYDDENEEDIYNAPSAGAAGKKTAYRY